MRLISVTLNPKLFIFHYTCMHNYFVSLRNIPFFSLHLSQQEFFPPNLITNRMMKSMLSLQ